MAIPITPPIANQDRASSVQPVQGTPVAALVAGVTLSSPSSATLITGLSQLVQIQPGTSYLMVVLSGENATVSAAATITMGAYTGATSGALTTLFADKVVVAPTGGTTVSIDKIFILPITGSQWNTSLYISIAATASSGNFVLNAGATTPTRMLVLAV